MSNAIDDGELIAEFKGYVKGIASDHRAGEIQVRLFVPMEFYDEAIALDKNPGFLFLLRAYKPPRPLSGTVEAELDAWMEGRKDKAD